jgi:hypothetical protein|tara:strand:- start:418 stop:1770 length:1353 start_codon:yes stop_codon:yes gene_type:complete
MYADFRSLEAISALVNIILGAITLILASRTKRNAWNELFAAKLLGWFLIFRGISMFSGYLQGYELWTGPSTYSLFEAPSDTNLFRFFQMLESITLSAEIAIMCSIPLFFPYPFLQTKNAQRAASVFILMFTIIISGFFVFFPYETSMVRYGFMALPLLIWGFVYVRFSLKELKHGDEEARTISSPSGLLILAMIGYWMTDWLLWITVPEKWSTPVWVNSLGPDLNLNFFFIRQSLILGVGTCCLLTMFVFEGIRSSRKGNSVLTGLTFGWFIVGIISFIADYSIFDTLEDCIYAVCDGLPEEWLIYNTFTNTLAGYLVQPIVLMYVLLNYDLVDSGRDENGTYARAMVIVLVVIVSSTLIEMVQSIIPIGEIITSAVLAIGIAAAIGWEKAIMEKFLAQKNSSAAYLQTINEMKDLEFDSSSERSFVISISTIVIFAFILSILNAALGLG